MSSWLLFKVQVDLLLMSKRSQQAGKLPSKNLCKTCGMKKGTISSVIRLLYLLSARMKTIWPWLPKVSVETDANLGQGRLGAEKQVQRKNQVPLTLQLNHDSVALQVSALCSNIQVDICIYFTIKPWHITSIVVFNFVHRGNESHATLVKILCISKLVTVFILHFHVVQDPPYPFLFFTSASRGYIFRDFGHSTCLY